MHQCKNADSTNAIYENEPMHCSNLNQALPKNTTKITSDISTENSIHLHIHEKEKTYSKGNKGGMAERHTKIKSYQSCLEKLRESTGYNEHMEIVKQSFDSQAE